MAFFPCSSKLITYGAGSKNVLTLETNDVWVDGVLVMIKFVDLDKAIPDDAFVFKVSAAVTVNGIANELDDKLIGVGSCNLTTMAFNQEIGCMGLFPRLFKGLAVEPLMKRWEFSFHSRRDYAGRAILAFACPVAEGAVTGFLPGVYQLRSRGEIPTNRQG